MKKIVVAVAAAMAIAGSMAAASVATAYGAPTCVCTPKGCHCEIER